jgi:hypothetical protein
MTTRLTSKPAVVHGVYGHKTKHDRQQEAKAAKHKDLDRREQYFRETVEYAASYSSESSLRLVEINQKRLVDAYVEAGYTRQEAQGMARSVRHGGERTAWLSGIDV